MDLTAAMACHLLLPLLLLLLPLLSSLFLLRSRKQQNKPSKAKLPPGPPRRPIFGNLHQLGDSPHRSLLQLSRKHGPLMSLQLGTVLAVVASSAATDGEFLKARDLECCSRPLLYSWRRLTYGYCDIAFSPYSDLWRVLRKNSIIEFFSSKKVALFRSIREEEVELMVSHISSRSKESAPINLSAVLLSLASDITCRAALGKKYRTGEGSQLYATLMETQAMLGGFFYADYLPVFGWLDVLSGMRARLEKNFRDLDSFTSRSSVSTRAGRGGGRIQKILSTLCSTCTRMRPTSPGTKSRLSSWSSGLLFCFSFLGDSPFFESFGEDMDILLEESKLRNVLLMKKCLHPVNLELESSTSAMWSIRINYMSDEDMDDSSSENDDFTC